jgi:hypothetical protein
MYVNNIFFCVPHISFHFTFFFLFEDCGLTGGLVGPKDAVRFRTGFVSGLALFQGEEEDFI